ERAGRERRIVVGSDIAHRAYCARVRRQKRFGRLVQYANGSPRANTPLTRAQGGVYLSRRLLIPVSEASASRQGWLLGCTGHHGPFVGRRARHSEGVPQESRASSKSAPRAKR